MSDHRQHGLRLLRMEEYRFVLALLGHVRGSAQLRHQLECARVRDMDDGGMGSLEFAGDEPRSLGSCLVEAEYVDSDGVLVGIGLNADKRGQLYELDIWKLDFAPLRAFPIFERVTIKT